MSDNTRHRKVPGGTRKPTEIGNARFDKTCVPKTGCFYVREKEKAEEKEEEKKEEAEEERGGGEGKQTPKHLDLGTRV